MKRLLITTITIIIGAVLFVLIITECTHDKIQDGTTSTDYKFETANFRYIKEFTYKNHDYIMFQTGGVNSATAGVVHNPDCKYCKQNEYEKSKISTVDSIHQ